LFDDGLARAAVILPPELAEAVSAAIIEKYEATRALPFSAASAR
jgi:hypothetical protein